MTTIWRHRLRRARFALTGLIAAAIIAVAALVALAQLLLPLAAHYPQRVAALIGGQIGQTVKFASMSGHWQPSGPLLMLNDVTIGRAGDAQALHLPEAEVKLDIGALLWPSRHLVNLRLRGLRLDLQRLSDGRWEVAGFGQAGAAPGQKLSLDSLPGNVWLEDLHVRLALDDQHKPYELRAPEVRLNSGDGRVRFAATIGRVGLTSRLNVVGEWSGAEGTGRLFMQASDVDFGRLLGGFGMNGVVIESGHGSMGVWLRWQQDRIDDVIARTDLGAMRFGTPDGPLSVPAWQSTLHVHRDAKGIEVLYDQGAHGALRLLLSGQGGERRIDASAHDLDLAVPMALAALAPKLPEGAARWLIQAHVHGRLDQADLHWSAANGLEWAQARLDGVGLEPVGAIPGVDTLTGEFRGDAEALSFDMPEQATTVRMTHLFRKPFVLSRLGGAITAWHESDGWNIGTGALRFDGEGYGGQARGHVLLPAAGGRPFVDLYAALDHGRVEAAKLFWPMHHMPPHTVEWLDRSLVSGQITSGACVLRGSLNDWPFRNHEGRFEARAHVSQAVLDYNPAWPRAEGIEAVARFIDNSMVIEGSDATTLGNRVTHVVASIPDYKLGELVLVAQGQGQGKNMLDFVRKSPVGTSFADAIQHLGMTGMGKVSLSLILPFKDVRDMQLQGTVDLSGTDVSNPDWKLNLKGVDGRMRFDAHGLAARNLAARFRGVPVSIDMDLGAATGQPDLPVQVRARGKFDVPTLIQGYDTLAPLARVAHGSAWFSIGVDVEHPAGSAATTQLQVDSDLAGITLDTPAPLAKPEAGAILPMHLTLGLPPEGQPIRLQLGDIARMSGRLEGAHGEPMALAVRLGADWPRSLPARGIRVEGSADVVDLSGWAQMGLAAQEGGPGLLDGVDVLAQHVELFGKRFDAMHVQLTPSPDTMTLSVDGPQVKGKLTLPTKDIAKRGVTARFDRLYWPSDDTEKGPAADAKPAADNETMPMMGLNPSKLPPLHLWVGELRLGAAHLGEARFESWPSAKGMHIDQLRTHSADVQLSASGDWNGDTQHNQTHLMIDFGAESLGHMLTALGFGGLFEGGRTQAHLDATWPGAPSAVQLANMQGTLKVDVGKGRIPEVQPGMGRLFGLMSIAELPRRFALDFGDVFGKGFGFDSIKGDFRLADGNAYTDNLHIKGPAADIRVTGRTGLRAHDYDQQVLVMPHVGSSLPVVGAIAGGPVGAAAGFAVQGLLGRGLNRVASARYGITGSWEKPQIKLLEKKTVPVKKAAPVPAPAASAAAPASAGSAAPAIQKTAPPQGGG